MFPLGWTFVTFAGGGNEELGWRGLLQPALEKKFSFPLATVITALVWVAWHLPLWLIPGTSQSQISYTISLDQNSEIPIIHFQKNEIFTANQESQQHLLTLTSESLDHNLQIFIDKEPLYVENIDLLEGNKLVFVAEKLNKFEFFFSDKEKELSDQREKIKVEKEKKA